MRIAVAGGTGVAGTYVVEAARTDGHDVVALSRRTGVDVVTGDGLARALSGAEVVVDALNVGTTDRRRATEFFVRTTRNLQQAAASAGVARIVLLSIVGIDRVPGFGYYAAKLAQEDEATKGPLPVTVVRATQFHEFAAQILGRMRLGRLALVPTMRIQPVAARSLGRCLVEVATGPEGSGRLEVAGPEAVPLVDLARQTATRGGRRTLVLPLPVPGRTGKALRHGALLAGPDARVIGPGPSEWLAGDDVRRVMP